MFAWQYDEETGGVLLDAGTPSPGVAIREPRPVYVQELRMRGFDRRLAFPEENAPVAWYEGARIYYRGRLLGRYKPESRNGAPPPPGVKRAHFQTLDDFIFNTDAPDALEPIDVETMNAKNAPAVERLFEVAGARILETMKNEGFESAVVSYSAGKDSEALLEVALRAVPAERLFVIFADTGMEFPTTYEVAEERRKALEARGVPFFKVSAPYAATETWRLFGAPSRAQRWCCSVHKSDPFYLLRHSREEIKRALVLCGVRRNESARRMNYELIARGKKAVDEITLYPLLDFSSLEVWSILYATDAPINAAYKMGNKRVGCLLCPMGSERTDATAAVFAPTEVATFQSLIEATEPANPLFYTGEQWRARRTANQTQLDAVYAQLDQPDGVLYCGADRAVKNWKEWLKLLPQYEELEPDRRFRVPYKGDDYEVFVDASPERVLFFVPKKKNSRRFCAVLRRLFTRGVYCVGCGHCPAQCPRAALRVAKDGSVELSDACVHCLKCVGDDCKRGHSLTFTSKAKTLVAFKDYGTAEWERVKRSI